MSMKNETKTKRKTANKMKNAKQNKDRAWVRGGCKTKRSLGVWLQDDVNETKRSPWRCCEREGRHHQHSRTSETSRLTTNPVVRYFASILGHANLQSLLVSRCSYKNYAYCWFIIVVKPCLHPLNLNNFIGYHVRCPSQLPDIVL